MWRKGWGEGCFLKFEKGGIVDLSGPEVLVAGVGGARDRDDIITLFRKSGFRGMREIF